MHGGRVYPVWSSNLNGGTDGNARLDIRSAVATIAAVLGGPALFLAGHALFKYLIFGVVSGVRLVAIALLAAFVPVAFVVPPLVTAAVATAIVAGVAVHESVFHPSAAAETESVTVEGA